MAQIFPRWTNQTPRLITLGALAGLGATVFAVYWWASPYHTDVGYAPKQPVEYSHELHAGTLKMDCRYCHVGVEQGAFAGVPPTQTCMNCHKQVKPDSELLKPVRESWATDKSIEWKRIHKLPDFAYFNHSAHVGVGTGDKRAAIGCETCHGRIDTMKVVRQVQPLSMSWCLDCHSNPGPNLRPVEHITTMGWSADMAWQEQQRQIAATLNPPGSLSGAQKFVDGEYKTFATAGCSGCHR
ncbi:MAG: cytochrome C [Archangium gephyra]|uniref:Cytochrome C n=1 Tax=Archangium gephyra TaxID=48 RepID=A0A2W5VBB0_9BACT|nr:MAG: cytochrome C [Archangium gephyra]